MSSEARTDLTVVGVGCRSMIINTLCGARKVASVRQECEQTASVAGFDVTRRGQAVRVEHGGRVP
jgi:hypothetical protein